MVGEHAGTVPFLSISRHRWGTATAWGAFGVSQLGMVENGANRPPMQPMRPAHEATKEADAGSLEVTANRTAKRYAVQNKENTYIMDP